MAIRNEEETFPKAMTKTFLIAGGTSGIGAETATLLRDSQHEVLLAGRGDSVDQPFDAENAESTMELPDQLHGAVYFPGTITLRPFNSLSDKDFQRDLEINLLGAVRFLRQAYPSLRKADSASVVLFSTVAVQTGMAYHSSIAAAKGAIEGLMRSLAAEWAPAIRVNCIAPSLTDTPLAGGLLQSNEKREAAAKRHPLHQVGDPKQLAELCTFLLDSERSGFITGQLFKADGGISGTRQL